MADTLNINGESREVIVPEGTPPLWVISDALKSAPVLANLTHPRIGRIGQRDCQSNRHTDHVTSDEADCGFRLEAH